MRTNVQLYAGGAFMAFLSLVSLGAANLHLQPKFRPTLAWFKDNENRLNHHLSVLFGFSSIAWAGHLIHVAIPISRGIDINWSNYILMGCW